MTRRGGVGIAIALVLLGSLLLLPIGGDSFFGETRARLSNGDVTIETTFGSDGTSGTFTATGVPICDAGEVTRQDSAIGATESWYEDEYQCSDGAGAFVLRGELLLDPDAAGDSGLLNGTWIVKSGRDDYGHLKGNGTSKVALGPPRTESYTGTLSNDG